MTQQSSTTETLISEFTLALLSAEEGAAGDLMRGLLARGVSQRDSSKTSSLRLPVGSG